MLTRTEAGFHEVSLRFRNRHEVSRPVEIRLGLIANVLGTVAFAFGGPDGFQEQWPCFRCKSLLDKQMPEPGHCASRLGAALRGRQTKRLDGLALGLQGAGGVATGLVDPGEQ